MTTSVFTKGTAVALALATAVTFAATDNADAGRRGRNAAGAAFAGAAVGLMAGAIIASQNRRHNRSYYYGYGPRYGYYGPRHGYYGPRHGYWGPSYKHRGPFDDGRARYVPRLGGWYYPPS